MLGLPDGFPPGAAVVVVQEFWGMNGNIESFVHRLGSVGYVAIAPDLYRGGAMDEPDEAKKRSMELDRPAALEDLRHCVSHVRNLGATAVGVLGFCMGGSLAWQLACTDDRLGAAMIFYGSPDDATPGCPVQAHYGTEDRFEPSMIDDLEGRLASLDNGSEVHRYEGAGHAFMNDTREAFSPEHAQVAWDRAIAFIERNLGAPVPV
jgi:carboxymethylenebutenolidase